ncbi:MAG: DNA/RNA non-specific endonuclease [Saprospiraceae bacterium]|nr:DNA/RNA non-specific endonuclease [Saprospiraceae bacterium]
MVGGSPVSESYLYSNMSPMLADFNRDSWAKLEDLFQSLYVQKSKYPTIYCHRPCTQ